MTVKDRMTKIEDALIKTHRSCTELETDTEWNMRVMAQVRVQGNLLQPEDRYSAVAQRFVWRFGAVICTLAIVLSIYTFGAGFVPEKLALNFFIDDPLVMLTTSLFFL